MRNVLKAATSLGVSTAFLLVGCQPQGASTPTGQLTVDITPESLLAPERLDWSLQRVSGHQIATAHQTHFQRKLLAFPTQDPAWPGGVALTSAGCTATDSVPNGPAAAFSSVAGVANRMFFLTKEGKFIKIDPTNASNVATVNLDTLGAGDQTFSRTYVTLSPRSGRAYLYSDAGVLFIIDTLSMTERVPAGGRIALGGGYSIAPFLDPFKSSANDSRDVLYLPANDGNVSKYVITPSGTAPFVTVASSATYAVATGITPLSGTRKIAAPAVVLNGVIYQGDQGGNVQVYDTVNTANNLTFGVGAPVNTSPAIEIQDGTYALTDPLGAPKTVPNGTPVFAFVNAGAKCAWLNLHDTSITFSQDLRIDDNDSGKKFGYLLDYNYSNAGTTETINAADGVNINTESPEVALPGYSPSITNNDFLVPAETNTATDAADAAIGGPIYSYLRFTSTMTHPVGSVINNATLTLRPSYDQGCRVPEIKTTSPYYKSTTSLWSSASFTNSNRPTRGTTNIGVYLSGGINGSGNVSYKDNKSYIWDVTSAFSAPGTYYALSMNYNAGGDAVLWPEGPVGGAVGKKAKKAYQVEAVKFLNYNAASNKPLLTLQIAQAVLPTPSIETPPVIDALNKRIYAFYTNALYSISYGSPTAFADTDASGTKYTLFNLAHYGDTANGGGGAFDANKKYVGNYSAPVLNYNVSACYVVSRYPNPDVASPTTWNYAVSKFDLPLSATANKRASSATFASINSEASNYLVIDPFSNAYTTGGAVYFGLGNGRIYQYDP